MSSSLGEEEEKIFVSSILIFISFRFCVMLVHLKHQTPMHQDRDQ